MAITILVSALIAVAIFLAGAICGAIIILQGYKNGANLVDRVQHDLTPFEDIPEETDIQTYTE